MPRSDTLESIDTQLDNLRSNIGDLGRQIDSYKTKTAAALGGGVFLLLLAAGAAYDLFAGEGGVWLTRGVTRETLLWVASGFGGGSIFLLAFALARVRRRDTRLDVRLDQLEQEYAELLERRNSCPSQP